MRKGFLLGLALLLALGLASSAWAGGTIKLGVMEPLSGTFKDIGDRYLEGAVRRRGAQRQGRHQRHEG